MSLKGAVPALALLLAAPPCLADRVVPSERVRSSVVLREQPKRGATPLGRLAKGEEARWLESVPGWHRVELADGASGFVSAAWTQRLEDPPAPPTPEVAELPPEPRPGFFERISYTVSRAFGGGAPVAIDIQEPLTARTRLRHPEPTLPVSGFAAAGGLVELVLAIDASTSANEFSESDVDGDGELEDTWAGDDSIYQAQILAARHLVAGLHLLPGNQEGERIRVAVVSFSGDDRYRLYEPDRDFDPTVLSILARPGSRARGSRARCSPRPTRRPCRVRSVPRASSSIPPCRQGFSASRRVARLHWSSRLRGSSAGRHALPRWPR